MESFVSVKTFFKKEEDRTIENLSNIYKNRSIIISSIKQIVLPYLDDGHITNKSILLKPNWVRHNIKDSDEICLCTNEGVILGLVEILLEKRPKSILIGDAPVQGCDWSKLLTHDFYEEIKQFEVKYNIPIKIKDFRKVAFNPETNDLKEGLNSSDKYVIFDVGKKSYLEDITSPNNTFRVTCYNPDKLAETHHKGMHKYCVIRDIFECDTVITITKMKTHQKAGLTNSLKILVGINGDKDYLPHHRIGAIGHGGDCYKGWNPLRRISELILDEANRHRGKYIYKPLSYLSAGLWRLSFPRPDQNLAAGWYGNDTVWRMVMDLNLIAKYGRIDGTLSDIPQRTLYTLCDGIIGGQGNGPLSPDPLALGILAFSNDAFVMDEVVGHLFRMNLDRIPLLKEAEMINQNKRIQYIINGQISDLKDIDKYSTNVIMPPGWINYNK